MKKFLIHYFSGTGNCRRAAGILKKKLEELSHSATVVNIEETSAPAQAETDIFIFPVYAMSVPAIMRDYMASLSPGGKAAVVAVFGNLSASTQGNPGAVTAQAEKFLAGKREVFFTAALGYPTNFTSFMDPPSSEKVSAIYAASDAEVSQLAEKIASGQKSFRKCAAFERALTNFFGPILIKFGRFFMGKCYAADAKCTSCGLCAKICPAKTISLKNDRPFWGWKCQACQRCINACPERAIQATVLRLFIYCGPAIFLPYNALLRFITGWQPSGIAAKLCVILAGYAVLCAIADAVLTPLERVKFLWPVVGFSLTKNRRRYLAKED